MLKSLVHCWIVLTNLLTSFGATTGRRRHAVVLHQGNAGRSRPSNFRAADPREGARNIMAYRDECDAVADFCPRIPNIVVDWFRTASAVHDNARRIKLEAPTLSQDKDSHGLIFKKGFD